MALKLNPWTYVIAGASLGLAALSVGYFMYFKPNMEEASNFDASKEEYDQEAAKMPRARKRVKDVTEKLIAVDSDWRALIATKTPAKSLPAGGIDLSVNRFQLTKDARTFRNSIQLAVNQQMRRGGIRVIRGPEVPVFSMNASDIVETSFNYIAFGFPAVVYDFGTVEVEGTWSQIRANVEAWSNMPNYFAVTDGLRITGTSPKLRGTYNVTLVGFIRADKIAPPVPEVAADANAANTAFSGAAPGGPGAPGAPGGGGEAAGRGSRPQFSASAAGQERR